MTIRRLIPTDSPRHPRTRRRLVPACERLETISLLSNASPVISGYVFADKNNDGKFQAGESPVAGTRVQLHSLAGALVGTATTNAKGFYAFTNDPTAGTTPQSLSQTLTLPAGYTNIDDAPLSSALALFNPALGTLVGVKITSVVTVSSTLQGENTSSTNPSDISGSVSASYQINGLGRGVSGTVSASTPVFHAGTFDGTLDNAGPSGVTFSLAPSDPQSATLSNPADLAFFTASAGRTSITPTATVHASITENGGSGNTQYQAATQGSAVVTVTFDYTPGNSLKPGVYSVLPMPPTGYVEGKASSQNGRVVNNPSGVRVIALTLTGAGSVQNNFGLLPAPKAPTTPTPAHGTKPVIHSTNHPSGRVFSGFMAFHPADPGLMA